MRRFIQRPLVGQPATIAYAGAQAQLRINGGAVVIPWTTGTIIATSLASRDDYQLEIRAAIGGATTTTDDVTVGVLALHIGDDHMARRLDAVAATHAVANRGYLEMALAGGFASGVAADFYAAVAGTYSWDHAAGTPAWTTPVGAPTRAWARALKAALAGTPPVGVINAAASGSSLTPEAATGSAYWLGEGVSGSPFEVMLARVAAAAGGNPEIVELGLLTREAAQDISPARVSSATRHLTQRLRRRFKAASFRLVETPMPKATAAQAALRARHASLARAQRAAVLSAPRWGIGAPAGGATERDDTYRTTPGYTLLAQRSAQEIARSYLTPIVITEPYVPPAPDILSTEANLAERIEALQLTQDVVTLGPGLFYLEKLTYILPAKTLQGTLGPNGEKLTEIRQSPLWNPNLSMNRKGERLICMGSFVAEGGYGIKLPYRPGPTPWSCYRAALATTAATDTRLTFASTAGRNKIANELTRLGVSVAFVWRQAGWHHQFNKMRPLDGTIVRITAVGSTYVDIEHPLGLAASDVWIGVASDKYDPTGPRGTNGNAFPPYIGRDSVIRDLIVRNSQAPDGDGTVVMLGAYNCVADNIENHGHSVAGGNSIVRSKFTNYTGDYSDRMIDMGFASGWSEFGPWAVAYVEKGAQENFQPLFQCSESSRDNWIHDITAATRGGQAGPNYDQSEGFRLNHVRNFRIEDITFDGGATPTRTRRGLIDEKNHRPEDFIALFPIDAGFNPVPSIKVGTSGTPQVVDGTNEVECAGSTLAPGATGYQPVIVARWNRMGTDGASRSVAAFRSAAGCGVEVRDSTNKRAVVVHYVNATYTPGAITNERDAFYNALDTLWQKNGNNFYSYTQTATQGARTFTLTDLVSLGGGNVLFGIAFDRTNPSRAITLGQTFTTSLFGSVVFTAGHGVALSDNDVPGAPAIPDGTGAPGVNSYGNVWGTPYQDWPAAPLHIGPLS